MQPRSHVDGFVADWKMEGGDPAGCVVAGLVVFLPRIGRKAFERSCDLLDMREDALAEAMAQACVNAGGRFAVIDGAAVEAAWERVEADCGRDGLHRFVGGVRAEACERIGAAFSAASAVGVSFSPARATEAVGVVPAMSFPSERSLAAWLRDGTARWKPSVRLTLSVTLDGPLGAVETAAADLRRELAACGPVAEWRQETRPSGGVAERLPVARLVSG